MMTIKINFLENNHAKTNRSGYPGVLKSRKGKLQLDISKATARYDALSDVKFITG
jgi:hypothetical protein